ncbi:MAG: hypothetical protein N7Q72_03835 [Spiroplasma sp. Tabriz.8]|nr:hypothetical protein [Spiroplasma sp. Tabriz.8]
MLPTSTSIIQVLGSKMEQEIIKQISTHLSLRLFIYLFIYLFQFKIVNMTWMDERELVYQKANY